MSVSRISELLELMVGCEVTRLIQVTSHVISITIVNAAASQTDTITINGTACSYVSDATPTKKEVSDGLKYAIETSNQANNVVVTQGDAPDYDLTIDTANALDLTVAVSANLADATATGYCRPAGADPCLLMGIILDGDLAGTLTLADNGTIKLARVTSAASAIQAIPVGGAFTILQVKISDAADTGCVMWMPIS